MSIFPELDLKHEKTSVTYTLEKGHPTTKKPVKITVTVHLDNKERTVTIRGLKDKFQFEKSDIWLVKTVNELIEKGLELADAEQRVKGKD